ncbi:hypothetical protein F2P81_012503 [Scophthalmus maximus]|uniref:CWH43-like N-terminal domain-containing protein n=1 Tax=Scophthalmus maximus TaxID=52904 RepID=A0A6A4SQE4_SCOMX|nr:hypothetical protein F2P81_012503 [Scophthalmus maximus]
MEAACWLAPGVLRRLIELPSPPLSRHQLKRLEEHRYSSAGRSLLEPLMQCYWEWLVGRVPSWIAPNLITIVGLATNVFTTLVLIYYCPTATEQIPVLNIQMKMIPAIFTFLGAIFSCTNYFRVIFTGGVGKNGSTIAGTSVLSPVLHIGSVIILAMMIYKKSAVQLFEKHPCLYILAFGFVSAKITNKLVIISFFDLVRYCVSVCNQIACHLHIFVFKIKPFALIFPSLRCLHVEVQGTMLCNSMATVYVRYKQVEALTGSDKLTLHRLNRFGLLLGFISSFGMCVVANFQTLLSLNMQPHVHSRSIYLVRLGIGVWTLSSIVSMFVSSVIMYSSLPGVDVPHKMHWTPGETGYLAHIISTVSEWSLAFSFISFFLTYIRDFQKINLRAEVNLQSSHLYDWPQGGAAAASQQLKREASESSPLLAGGT